MKIILFTSDMVRAILDGRKTQTRRIITERDCWRNGLSKKHNIVSLSHAYPVQTREYLRVPFRHKNDPDTPWKDCGSWRIDPKWEVGDTLGIRETVRTLVWQNHCEPFCYGEFLVEYVADKKLITCPPELEEWWRRNWRKRPAQNIPSIHMPNSLIRLKPPITGIRVEMVQDISEADAKAEGVAYAARFGESGYEIYADTTKIKLHTLRCSTICTTARRSFHSLWDSIHGPGAWEKNEWLWVVEFKRTEKPK